IAGSSALLLASSIRFDPRLELLPRTEGDDAPRADGNLLAGLWIAPGALVFIAQVEVAEARELHLLARRQCGAHFLEEHVHELARFALVEAELVEERFGHFRFGECHALLISYRGVQ